MHLPLNSHRNQRAHSAKIFQLGCALSRQACPSHTKPLLSWENASFAWHLLFENRGARFSCQKQWSALGSGLAEGHAWD